MAFTVPWIIPMPVTAKILQTLIDSELARVSDARVVRHVRGMLVEPYVVLRDWGYGDPGDPAGRYECDHSIREQTKP